MHPDLFRDTLLRENHTGVRLLPARGGEIDAFAITEVILGDLGRLFLAVGFDQFRTHWWS